MGFDNLGHAVDVGALRIFFKLALIRVLNDFAVHSYVMPVCQAPMCTLFSCGDDFCVLALADVACPKKLLKANEEVGCTPAMVLLFCEGVPPHLCDDRPCDVGGPSMDKGRGIFAKSSEVGFD